MGVPTSEVSYTSAMPLREDHEVHKRTCGGIGEKKKKNTQTKHPQKDPTMWSQLYGLLKHTIMSQRQGMLSIIYIYIKKNFFIWQRSVPTFCQLIYHIIITHSCSRAATGSDMWQLSDKRTLCYTKLKQDRQAQYVRTPHWKHQRLCVSPRVTQWLHILSEFCGLGEDLYTQPTFIQQFFHSSYDFYSFPFS